jgi:N,N-dimethylformamidase
LGADLYITDWLEAKGYDFDVITDEDLHVEGRELLAPYRVVLTGSHPEYWTTQMYEGLQGYLNEGGRMMYLGGNGFYWVTSIDPERPHIVELRRGHTDEFIWESAPGEYYHSTTGEIGGTWRLRGKPGQTLAGVGFTAQGFDYSLPYRRQPGSYDPRAAFIFEGIGDEPIGAFGLVMGGAAGFEIDRLDYGLGTPPHALLLATATGYSDSYDGIHEDWIREEKLAGTGIPQRRPSTPWYRGSGGTVNPLVRCDMVYFEGPNGGAVFSTGSIAYSGSLSYNNYDNNVSRLTENVLRRFMSDEPLVAQERQATSVGG